VKHTPAVALAPLALGAGRGGGARILGAAFGTAALGYAAALAAGFHPFPGGLGTFLAGWRFGSPAYTGLLALGLTVAPLAAAALMILAALTAVRPARSPAGNLQAAFACFFLASPVVFPWYLAVVVPIVALAPSVFWIAWLSVVPLSYEVLDLFDLSGQWSPSPWPLFLLVAAWIIGWGLDRKARRWREI
jgi:hypothetical protein